MGLEVLHNIKVAAGSQEPLHETEKEGGRLQLHTFFFFSRAAVSEVLVSWQSQRWDVTVSVILHCQNSWHEPAAWKEKILLKRGTIKQFRWWHGTCNLSQRCLLKNCPSYRHNLFWRSLSSAHISTIQYFCLCLVAYLALQTYLWE